MVNLLNCWLLKVSHHGSMHAAPLDVYERMTPSVAVISTRQEESIKMILGRMHLRELFPHRTTSLALKETGAVVLTTDGSTERKGSPFAHEGTVVAVIPRPGAKPRYTKLRDKAKTTPRAPVRIP